MLDEQHDDAASAALALDASFDVSAMHVFAEDAFRRTRQAYEAGQLEDVSSLLGGEVLEHLTNHRQNGQATHVVVGVERIQSLSSSIMGATEQGNSLEVRVRFVVAGEIGDLPLTPDAVVDEPLRSRSWQEIWTFRRGAGATTTATICQNCGAPAPAYGGPCAYCHAWIQPGTAAWTVVELESYA